MVVKQHGVGPIANPKPSEPNDAFANFVQMYKFHSTCEEILRILEAAVQRPFQANANNFCFILKWKHMMQPGL